MQGLPFLKRLLLQGVLFLRKKYDENTGGWMQQRLFKGTCKEDCGR